MSEDGERDEFEAVLEVVRERVEPTAAEREALTAAVERLADRTRAALEDLDADLDADVMQVGSTARGTWIRGDRDIDLFVRFSPDLPRADLERYGLAVGNRVLPDGHEEYAEHPYVRGRFEGYEVDLVPCYRVPDATEIRSAVDRTPFHTAYLRERIDDEAARDVRLAKQFLKGVGAYGSDLRTRGFSGYLTELLVLAAGGFRAFLTAARDWQPPVRLDPEDHGTREFDDPLVVVDPTDPGRNVAAVVTAENVARLQHHARAALADPDVERFFPSDPEPLDPEAVREHVAARNTTPLAVVFDAPDLVDDQLYPQLRRSLEGLVGGLDRRGFDVLRATTAAGEDAMLFAELAVAERPRVERHEGPPVHVGAHAADFYAQYADSGDYGPFIDGDRYVVERDREETTAAGFARNRLLEVSLGAQVREALEENYRVLVGDDVAGLADDPVFGVAFARYFQPEP